MLLHATIETILCDTSTTCLLLYHSSNPRSRVSLASGHALWYIESEGWSAVHGFPSPQKPLLSKEKIGLLPTSRGFLVRGGVSRMTRDEEKILKIAKEVVVKFIEIGRVSPTQFEGVFQSVFRTIKSSVSSEESKQ